MLCAVHEGAARFDAHALTDNTRMELLLMGAMNSSVSPVPASYPEDPCAWRGVSCSDGHEVNAIEWDRMYRRFGGTMMIRFLPRALRKLKASRNNFQGSFDVIQLPAGLEVVNLSTNRLEGSVDLTALPQRLVELNLRDNALAGFIELCHLPVDLERLYLDANNFQGKLDITALPKSLSLMQLDANSLRSTVSLSQLTKAIVWLKLDRNALVGSVDLTNLPSKIRWLSLNTNHFEGPICLECLPPSLLYLYLQENAFRGTICLDSLPTSMAALDLSKNPDLRLAPASALPPCVQADVEQMLSRRPSFVGDKLQSDSEESPGEGSLDGVRDFKPEGIASNGMLDAIRNALSTARALGLCAAVVSVLLLALGFIML